MGRGNGWGRGSVLRTVRGIVYDMGLGETGGSGTGMST
jgi:hypothetical protein